MIRRKSAPIIVPGIDLPSTGATAPRPTALHVEGAAKTALETGRTRLTFAGGVFMLLFAVVAMQLVNVAFRPN
ncbi:MAG: hypothetical protein JXQ84_05880, partial [Rhodospirillaceae bacterium]|nr:hypothetical protein [Rhodospirillaceae bacterium]